jgi:hypothetical protein
MNVMTYKEAINELKSYADHSWGDLSEAFKLAIESMEKQIPKKPKIESWSPALCPACGEELSESIGDGYYKHWYNKEICDCGQKLKWE